MRTVHEVSKLTGVSIRTLHHYDQIGLLHPAKITDAGYRLYDDDSLEKLQQILLFRELKFPLKDIKKILESPDFDRDQALCQQIELLELQKRHLEELIDFARKLQKRGKNMSFKAFDTKELEKYTEEAKAKWGTTKAWHQFEQKDKNRSKDEYNNIAEGLMKIFEDFGVIKNLDPGETIVQEKVKELQAYITEHFYNCTDQILSGLGQMYSAGGSMTENIDARGGNGTAEFVTKAIQIYCA